MLVILDVFSVDTTGCFEPVRIIMDTTSLLLQLLLMHLLTCLLLTCLHTLTAAATATYYSNQRGFFLGCETNNVAEYVSLIRGLEASKKMGVRKVLVRGDSKLVLQQVQGLWQCRHLLCSFVCLHHG